MTNKTDLRQNYEYFQTVLNNIGKELDEVAVRNLAGAVRTYPNPFSDPELNAMHTSLTNKAGEVLKKMHDIQGELSGLTEKQ
jgi:hypothetical protein